MTHLTTENAAEHLQPLFDDLVGQVKGLLTPVAARAEEAVALAQKASESAPAEPTAEPTSTPDIDITDPEAVEQHLRSLKAAKAQEGLDMTNPADVETYLERIGHKRQEEPSAPEAAELTELQAAKASAEAALSKAQDALAQAEARSNQGVYSVATKASSGTDHAVALGEGIASFINGEGSN